MGLGSIQVLKEMSMGHISWRVKTAGA